MKNLTEPHEQIDARDPHSKPITLEGAIAGHVLVKNENKTLPFKGPLKMISVFGYDATIPQTKNTDKLFELGYTSSEEMAQENLGTPQHFDQAARGGTIVTGGRAGANAPAYMIDVGELLDLDRNGYSNNTISHSMRYNNEQQLMTLG
jgi:beta-glucosidase